MPHQVVAIIHGGGFIAGSSASPHGSPIPLAAFGDVVVVNFNYRLGIFGFADMGEYAPGNLGLHDQRSALQWIHDHIADFGGDPEQVTVIGASAGSMSLAAQIITPIDERTLIRSAILDAGVVASNGFHETSRSSYTRLKKIARQVGCPVDSTEMVACLRRATVEELLPLSLNTTGDSGITFFVATDDGKFVPKDVEEYVEENSEKLRKVRTIIGYSKDEGTFFVSTSFLDFNFKQPETRDKIFKHIKILSAKYNHRLNFENDETKRSFEELYVEKYPRSSYQAIAEFQADGVFKCPINTFIRSYSRRNDELYVYQFERKLQSKNLGIFNPDVRGAFHCSAYIHFVGALLTGKESVASQDKIFSLDAISLISSFAKNDKALIFRGARWPSFSKSGEILVFDENPSVRRGLSSERNCRDLFKKAVDGEGSETRRTEL